MVFFIQSVAFVCNFFISVCCFLQKTCFRLLKKNNFLCKKREKVTCHEGNTRPSHQISHGLYLMLHESDNLCPYMIIIIIIMINEDKEKTTPMVQPSDSLIRPIYSVKQLEKVFKEKYSCSFIF